MYIHLIRSKPFIVNFLKKMEMEGTFLKLYITNPRPIKKKKVKENNQAENLNLGKILI